MRIGCTMERFKKKQNKTKQANNNKMKISPWLEYLFFPWFKKKQTTKKTNYK